MHVHGGQCISREESMDDPGAEDGCTTLLRGFFAGSGDAYLVRFRCM